MTENHAKRKLTPIPDNLNNAIGSWWKNISRILGVYWEALRFAWIPLLLFGVGRLHFYLVDGGRRSFLHSGFLETSFGSALIGAATFLALVLVIYYAIRAYISLFLLVKGDFKAEPGRIFSQSADLVASYILVSLLTAVLVALWTLLLIIPGIIFGVFYSLAIYVLLFEAKRGREAVRRSRELVSGYWWAVFGRLLVIGIFFSVIASIVDWPLNFLAEDSFGFIAWTLFAQIIQILLGPIIIIYLAGVYQDLKSAKA